MQNGALGCRSRTASLQVARGASLGPCRATSLLDCLVFLEQRRGVTNAVDRGKRTLQVPPGVSFSVNLDPPKPKTHYIHPIRVGRSLLTVKGPKGSVEIEIPNFMRFEPPLPEWEREKPSSLRVFIDDERIPAKRMMWNTVNTHIGTAMEGVTQMHEAEINLVGVGYRVTREEPPFTKVEQLPPWLSGKPLRKELPRLVFRIGHPDDRIFDIPEGWEAVIKSPTHVVIRSPNKMKLGNYCSDIRRHQPPEPYNGKGVFVNGETIKRREVKRR